MPTIAGDPAPGRGVVVLELHASDFNLLLKKLRPQGIPAVTTILYIDIDPENVKSDLTSGIETPLPSLSEKILKAAWEKRNGLPPPSGTTSTALQEEYAKGIIENSFFLFVEGGTDIGLMPLEDEEDQSNPRCSFTLRFLDNLGNDISPIPYIEGMPSYGNTNKWDGHPLIKQLVSLPASLNAHVRFEAWNPTAKAYQPLVNRSVEIKDFDPVSGDDTLAPSQKTDIHGQVSFQISDLASVDQKKPDVYFEIDTQGLSLGGLTFPSVWSTKGWKAVGGEPGYYDNFVGTQLGSASDPLVFRVGFDFHLRFTYLNQSDSSSPSEEVVPKDVIVTIMKQQAPEKELEGTVVVHTKTDAKGEVSGVIFDIIGSANSLDIVMYCEIDDPDIKLKMGVLSVESMLTFVDINFTTLRTTIRADRGIAPYIRTKPVDINAAIYWLVLGRELATFLHILSGSRWKGLKDIKIVPWAPKNSFSWPKGWVFIESRSKWNRSTILHEFGHQVVWNEADVSQLAVGAGGLFVSEVGNSFVSLLNEFPNINIPAINIVNHLHHDIHFLSNPYHAFLEGWPEFLADVLSGNRVPPNWRTDAATDRLQERVVTGGNNKIADTDRVLGPIGSSYLNRGESVEGAFANALWTIFHKHVIRLDESEVPPSLPMVPPTTNGDILPSTPWLADDSKMLGIGIRFRSMILLPLRDLARESNQDTITLIEKTRARNPADWHKLLEAFQQFNLAMSPPTISSISPTQGLARGGTIVNVRGENFTTKLEVTFGDAPASEIVVISSTKAQARTPSGTGSSKILVKTKAGTATASVSFQYLESGP